MALDEFPEFIKKDSQSENLTAYSDSNIDELDKNFQDSGKKHRNWIANMDHVYELITHPLVIIIICVLLCLVFLVSKYLEDFFPDIKIFIQLHQDAGKFLSYLGTVIITYIITRFIEREKKHDH